MQFLKNIKQTQQKKDFIEIVLPFDNPIDLYIRTKDINNHAAKVHFFSYRMAKDKIILWGIYDTESDTVTIESGCNDTRFQLAKLIKTWKKLGFNHVGAPQKDNFTSQIFSRNSKLKNVIKTLNMIAWKRGELTDYEMAKDYNYTLDDLLDFDILISKDQNKILADMEEDVNPPLKVTSFLRKPIERINSDRTLYSEIENKEKEELFELLDFMYEPLFTYHQYRKLKTDIELYKGKIDPSMYVYGSKNYQLFLDKIFIYSRGNVEPYIDFLENYLIKDYENAINFISVDQLMIDSLDKAAFKRLTHALIKIKEKLEKMNMVKMYSAERCPLDEQECISSRPKGCEIYHFGTPEVDFS
jgi:hypothetical protein